MFLRLLGSLGVSLRSGEIDLLLGRLIKAVHGYESSATRAATRARLEGLSLDDYESPVSPLSYESCPPTLPPCGRAQAAP